MKIKVYRDILAANDVLAAENRRLLRERGILCLNLIGSPGSGKTLILERVVELLGAEGIRPAVIEGDLATTRDAERIERHGAPAVQINTEGGCHLDAGMIRAVMNDLPLDALDVIFVENVGNLVCPAEFDLGEAAKVVVYSAAEGDDKPLKYPVIFRNAKFCLLNKADLLPHLDFDRKRVEVEIREINPDIQILVVSAKTGVGLDRWIEVLKELRNVGE